MAVAVALGVGAGLAGATVLPGAAGAAASPTVVTVVHNKTWGTILALGNGDTVYRLTADPANKSVCSGACATAWPPVLLAAGQRRPVGHGVSGLGTITRAGGAPQVTYEGIPLYRYVGDRKAGQANGNIRDAYGQWWVVNPAHPRTAPSAAKSSDSSSSSSSTSGKTPGSSVGSGVSY